MPGHSELVFERILQVGEIVVQHLCHFASEGPPEWSQQSWQDTALPRANSTATFVPQRAGRNRNVVSVLRPALRCVIVYMRLRSKDVTSMSASSNRPNT